MTSADSVLSELLDWPVDHSSAIVESLAENGSELRTAVGDLDRVFPLASVSKLITAYTVLIAVSEECFALDDTVGDIAARAGSTVEGPQDATVRELLCHASGVGFQSRERRYGARRRRLYSSAGFEILADLVTASVAEVNLNFRTYAHAALHEPLGIAPPALRIEGSAGHGFSGTAEALSQCAREFLSPTLLPESLWAEALRPQFPDLNGIVPGYGQQRPCPWGLGMELHGTKDPHWLSPLMPPDVAGHFGQSGTFLWFHRASGTAAVVLSDRAFGDWAKVRWTAMNSRLWTALSLAENT